MQKRIFWIVCFLSFAASIHAQKYSNEFLSIGVDARAHGMGKAVTAHVSDATAGFWNPAGLVGVRKDMQLAYMRSWWFGGIGQFDYVGLVGQLPKQNKKRVLGFSMIRLGVDNIPNTLSLYEADGSINYNNVTTFSASDYAFMLHYAEAFPSKKNPDSIGLRVGATPKVVYRKIGPFANSWGFGVDIGAQYQLKDWHFGLQLKDITTTFNAWRFSFTEEEKQVLALTNNEIPIKTIEITNPQIILGAAYKKDFVVGKGGKERGDGTLSKPKLLGLTTEIDLQLTTDGRRNVLLPGNPISMDAAVGMELHYDNLIFIRAGLNNFQRFENIDLSTAFAVQPNFGVGFRIYQFEIDYAISNLGGNSGMLYSHLISLKIGLDYEFFEQNIREAS